MPATLARIQRHPIKGIGSVKCSGLRNIPDGEVYSCPVRDSTVVALRGAYVVAGAGSVVSSAGT